jgi:hypothetical protein
MATHDHVSEAVGYIKYYGKAVEEGVIDANAAGNALIGLSEALKYFNAAQSPELAKAQYEIPVQTTKGSWQAWILASVGAGGGAFALSYLKKAGEKLAENDFKDIGLKDVFLKSVDALQNLVRLVKHTKQRGNWRKDNLHIDANNDLVGFPDSEGRYFYAPLEYIKWYSNLPPHLLHKLVSSVEVERSLEIAARSEGNRFEQVTVNSEEKILFMEEDLEEPSDVILPELTHGQRVSLEGKLTRGNESANSLGFDYQGHILNCHPESGSIRKYKPALFLHCIMDATITRISKDRRVLEKRPSLIVHKVTPLETDSQTDLFK